MNPLKLVENLDRSGVALAVNGSRLIYDAPADAITPDLLAAMKDHKLILLAMKAVDLLAAIVYYSILMTKHDILTTVMLKAIHDSGQSLYHIAKESGVDKASLGRFVAGKQSIRLDRASKLAVYLGLELVKKGR